MNTIFRKVSTRLPNKTGLYHTNRGMINYFNGLKTFEGKAHIQYWLEEVELPNDEQIEKESVGAYDETCYIKGAKWMRNFVLAVTAKDNCI